MKFLSLDQAMKTSGGAIFDDDKLIDYGTFTIKSTLPIEQRLAAMGDNLGELYKKHEFRKVIFEDTQLQGGNVETFRKLCYVQAAVIQGCYYSDLKFTIYSPSSWRALLGKGGGRKREEQKAKAIEIVKDKFNKEVTTDEADAVCIGLAYRNDKGEVGNAF